MGEYESVKTRVLAYFIQCQLLKMARSRYIAILIKSEKGLELVSSLMY